jgi:glycerol-3-phosphate acyltransferase PlsY
MVELVLSAVLGYLLGSVPTGVLVCRLVRGVDVRQQGSGHTGGLNVTRTAGLPAGILTGVVDALLGAGAVALASWLTDDPWAVVAAGVMAVVGHNWSVLIRFGGGIGISSLAGAMLVLSPGTALTAAVVLLALWLLLIKPLRVHRARATIVAMALVGPLLWAIGGDSLALQGILLGVLGGAAVAIKTIPDWDRQYSRDGAGAAPKQPGADSRL